MDYPINYIYIVLVVCIFIRDFCLGGLQWVVQGAIEVDIGANPSAEGGEDEGVDDQATKVVDIVDTFRLQVSIIISLIIV